MLRVEIAQKCICSLKIRQTLLNIISEFLQIHALNDTTKKHCKTTAKIG